jgi:hypothetical protein
VASYDVSDPSDIQFLDKLQSDPGSGAVPHNTYWLDHYLVTSYYTYGVTIYDAMRPHNLVEVGHYDTTPLSGPGFNGAWGVYPFFDSKRLIVSDIQLGLFVLDPTYVRACWLEGTITNAVTGTPIGQATITIQGLDVSDLSGLDGGYGTGHVQAGVYSVEVWAAGFEAVIVEGVVLENGELTLLDVQLVPLGTFSVQGSVIDAVSGAPIEGAQVVLSNDIYWFSATTDDQGWFLMPAVYEDQYEVLAGIWGWRTACPDPIQLSDGSEALQLSLEPGYYDDMELDFGWTVTSDATSGFWVRGAPVGTVYLGQQSNPGSDVEGDCGDKAWVTGNAGGSAGDDDVDGGWTLLSSPLFDLSDMIDPHVTCYRWFFNGGGAANPNDWYKLILVNGVDSVVVETITAAPGTNAWILSDFRVLDHMQPTANMRFHAMTIDLEPGHLVEAGLDLFQVIEMGTIGMREHATNNGILIHPNPSAGRFTIAVLDGSDAMVEVIDAIGRNVSPPARMRQGMLVMDHVLPAGTYFLRVTPDGGLPLVERIVVERN